LKSIKRKHTQARKYTSIR